MSLTPNVYLQVRDGQTYAPKLLDPGVVGPITWDYQEQGGLAQIKATLFVSWETTGIATGDYMEVWVLGESVPRARGIVSTPESELGLKETKTLIAMGRMADMDKVLDYKTIFHPSGSPQDLSYYASELLSDYQKRKAVGTAFAPPLDIDVQITGSSMESLSLTPGSVRAGNDTLYAQAGGNVVWGWDIHPITGNDRFYFRLRQSVVGFQCFVSDKVKLLLSPSELVPLTNGAYLKGGPAKFPNLLTNASFEQPMNPTADSGSLLQNGGFELGTPGSTQDNASGNNDVLGWSLSPSASRNQHDPGSNHNASAHTGDWYLLLDGPSDSAFQDVAVTVGTAYLATIFDRAENALHLPAGALTITGRDASGNVTETPQGGSLSLAPQSVTWSGGAASSVVGSDALQTSLVFVNPATVKARVSLTCTAASAGYGLCIDDVTFGPVGAVGQYGWSTHLQNPGSAANSINSVIWACKAAAWDGAYGVRLSVTADFSNKPVLAPAGGDNSGASQFHFKPGPQQSLQCGFFARMTIGQNTGAGAARSAYREWAGDGHETQSQFSQPGDSWPPNIPNDGLWHLVVVNISAHGDASTATMQVEFGVSGVYDLDGFFVMDAAHPIVQAQDPQSANYLRGADFERYVTAEAVCTSGSPADLAAAASYQTWGRREALVTNDQITDWTPDAACYMQAYFQRAAVLQQRPRVELISEFTDIILPGDGTQVQVSGTKADSTGRSTDIAPQWVSHATYSWAKGSLGISLDLSNERPTEAKLLKAATASAGSASSSVGAPTGGGQMGATTPSPQAVSSVNAQTGAVVLSAGNVGAEPALGDPAADGYVLTSTADGVRSWTVPGASFAAAPPLVPTGISQVASYNGSTLYIQAVPAFYSGMDPAPSVPYVFWQKSTDGGSTWTGYDNTSATTFPGPVLQASLAPPASGAAAPTIRFRVRTENASGTASAWYAQTADTAYAAPPSAAGGVTSVAGRVGDVTLSAADVSGLGTAAQADLPAGGSNASAAQVVRGDDTRLGGSITVAESLGSGADMALTTAYATVPNISLAVPASQAVSASALVELTADSGSGSSYDDLYVQLYDSLAGAAIAGSERHISHLPAGKRGLVTLEKFVPAASGGRTLVLQAKNGTAARGTVSGAKSLLQTLALTSGTTTGTGTGSASGPGGVSAGLLLWLKADAIPAQVNGTAIPAWLDSSGNGYNATAAGTAQPTYLVSGLNGLPALTFNGTSNAMDSPCPSATGPLTVFAVIQPVSSSGNQAILGTPLAGGFEWRLQGAAPQVPAILAEGQTQGPVASAGVSSTAASVIAFTLGSASSGSAPYAFYAGAAAAGSGTTSLSLSVSTVALGKYANGGVVGELFGGLMAEIIQFNRVLTSAEMSAVTSYLRSKWSV